MQLVHNRPGTAWYTTGELYRRTDPRGTGVGNGILAALPDLAQVHTTTTTITTAAAATAIKVDFYSAVSHRSRVAQRILQVQRQIHKCRQHSLNC